MTFDDVSAPVDQEFDLHPDNTGTLEYSTKLVFIYVGLAVSVVIK